MDNGTRDDEVLYVEDAPRPAARAVPVIPDEPGFLRRNLVGVLLVVALVLLAVFIGQNWKDVPMDAFFWSFETKLSFALIASALAGVLLGWIVPILVKRRNRRK